MSEISSNQSLNKILDQLGINKTKDKQKNSPQLQKLQLEKVFVY